MLQALAYPLARTADDLPSGWTAITDFLTTILPYFPLAIAGTVVWALWLYRVILSARTGPIESDFRTTTSVVVPSYHEDPDILLRLPPHVARAGSDRDHHRARRRRRRRVRPDRRPRTTTG